VLRNRIEHALLLGCRRKQRVLQVRGNEAEQGGAEQQPAQKLPHHLRLAEPLHQLAECAADEQQDPDLGEEDCRRGARNLAFRGQSDRGGAAEQGRSEQDRRQGRACASPPRRLAPGPQSFQVEASALQFS
jgi:hypothetical protein